MKSILFLALIAMSWSVSAQELFKMHKKKIEVRGTAEKEVVPDEIYLRITLKEYKSGGKKVEMNQLEAGLLRAVRQLKIDEKDLTVDNIFGYNWNWRKKRSDEFLASKSFRLKVNDLKFVNDLVDKMDSEGVNQINIAETTHSKIDEYKMELKAVALKAAKEKAGYLLGSIDEKLGGALEIQEIEYGYQPQPMYRNVAFDAVSAESKVGYQSELEFKSITIRAEFRVVFEID